MQKVKVTAMNGTYSLGAEKYGPFVASKERPYLEVPEALASALGLPLLVQKEAARSPESQAGPGGTVDQAAAGEGTPLPEGFPHRDLLQGAGLTTLEAVRQAAEGDGKRILDVNGIAEKGLETLRKAVRAL